MALDSAWPACQNPGSANWQLEPDAGTCATPASSTPSTPCTNFDPDTSGKIRTAHEKVARPAARRLHRHCRLKTRANQTRSEIRGARDQTTPRSTSCNSRLDSPPATRLGLRPAFSVSQGGTGYGSLACPWPALTSYLQRRAQPFTLPTSSTKPYTKPRVFP